MRATQILSPRAIAVCLCLLFLSNASQVFSAEDSPANQPDSARPGHPADLDARTRREVKDVARLAYLKVYDGWSTDEVLLQTELNDQFLAECHRRMPDIPSFDFNWTLLNLRKAGELRDVSASKRRRDNSDAYLHAAEIAARFLEDRYSVNTDRILCDSKLRAEYDNEAKKVAPKVDLATNGVKGVTLELHAFAADSPARLKPMRRAYESELIRSRKPRFNLAP